MNPSSFPLLLLLLGYMGQPILAKIYSQESTSFSDSQNFHEFETKETGNQGLDPCEDFHQFVCSQARPSNPKLNDTNFGKWPGIVGERIKDFLENDIRAGNDENDMDENDYDDYFDIDDRDKNINVLRMAKQHYKTCMEVEKRENTELDFLITVIEENGGLPMATNLWKEKKISLLETQKYENSLFSIRIESNRIFIDQHDMSAYGKFLPNRKHQNNLMNQTIYKESIKKIIKIIALRNNKVLSLDVINKDIDDLMEFRNQLHKIARLDVSIRAYIPHTLMRLNEMRKLFDINREDKILINWQGFIKNVFKYVSNFNVNGDTLLDVNIQYLRKLFNLLKNVPHRTIVNHINLHFFESHMKDTNKELRNIYTDMSFAANRLNKPLQGSEWCISEPHFIRAMEYMYLRTWYSTSERKASQRMVTELEKSLKEQIRKSVWMNEKTRILTRDQLKQLQIIIGSEDKYADYNVIKSYFQYQVTSNYLETLLNAHYFYKEIEFAGIREQANKVLGNSYLTMTDVIFDLRKFLIVVPITYLYEKNLSPTLPAIYSYAALGRVISALLNEYILQRGGGGMAYLIQQDAIISVKKYGGHSEEEFQSRIENLTHEYLQIIRSGMGFQPDSFTQYPIIFDQMSTVDSYRAYQRIISKNKAEKDFMRNHNLNDTDFFIAFGKGFCENHTQTYIFGENTVTPVQFDNRIRLNGMLSMTKAFGEAFHCAVGKPMNPKEKISFWN